MYFTSIYLEFAVFLISCSNLPPRFSDTQFQTSSKGVANVRHENKQKTCFYQQHFFIKNVPVFIRRAQNYDIYGLNPALFISKKNPNFNHLPAHANSVSPTAQ